MEKFNWKLLYFWKIKMEEKKEKIILRKGYTVNKKFENEWMIRRDNVKLNNERGGGIWRMDVILGFEYIF